MQEIWDLNFKEYRDHVLQIGSEAGLSAKFGVWLTMQRGRYRGTGTRAIKLSPEQIAQLESVPGFLWNPLEKKDHCLRGHPYTPENTYTKKNGQKFCLQCRRERRAANRKPKAEAPCSTSA